MTECSGQEEEEKEDEEEEKVKEEEKEEEKVEEEEKKEEKEKKEYRMLGVGVPVVADDTFLVFISVPVVLHLDK